MSRINLKKRQGHSGNTIEAEAAFIADEKITPKEEEHVVGEISLARQISGTKQKAPGAQLTRKISLLNADTCEYLVLSNALIGRGIEQTSTAIVRNGFEVITETEKDANSVKMFRENSRFDDKLLNIVRNTVTYGNGYFELYDDDKLGVMCAELPPGEMDFLRDNQGNINYDKNGNPEGYVQKRGGKEVASWKSDLIAHCKFMTLGTSDLGISMLQSLVYPSTEYGMIRANSAESFIRSLNVVQIQIDGATPEDIEEVSYQLADNFSAETVYVTSKRYDMNSVSNVGNNVKITDFIEPSIAEIAAGFLMPIELLAATQYHKGDDFQPRYLEWLASIKSKQNTLARMLEKEVFGKFLDNPCKVKFNNPEAMDTNVLIGNIGFAVQSGAISEAQAQEILNRNQVFGANSSVAEGSNEDE